MTTASACFLLYLPVYHQGHENLWERYPQVKDLYLLTNEDLVAYGPTRKDIHGLPVVRMQQLLRGMGRFERVELASEHTEELMGAEQVIIPADELVGEWVAQNLPNQHKVQVEDIWLRWTKKSALHKKLPHVKTPEKIPEKIAEALQRATTEGNKSSDWWRRVGCVLLLASGEVITAHNQHLPESETPNIRGDVRSQFHKGDHFELTSAIHAEATTIARAAKEGKATAGASIVVTDFPCPVCAKLIAEAGIKEVYFHCGYAMLDGEEILASFGIKVWQI